MGIESFFTTLTSHNASANSDALKAGAPKNGALAGGASAGESFLEFILSRLNEADAQGKNAQDNPADTAQNDDLLQSDNPLLEKDTKLDLAKIIADNPEIVEEIEDFIAATGLPPEVALAQTLELNKQAFDNVLKPLTDGVITLEEIENGSPRLLQALLIEGEASEELVTANLTPEQLAALKKFGGNLDELVQLIEPQTSIENGEEQTLDPALQNLLAIFFPPQNVQKNNAQNNAPFSTQQTAQTVPVNHSATPLDALAARLNGLNVGGDGAVDIAEYEGNPDILNKAGKLGKAVENGNFEIALKNAQNAPNASQSQSLNILQSLFAGTFASPLVAPFEMSTDMLNQYGLNTAANAPATVGTMSAILTQAQSAAQAHPATHMIAATIQKAAGNGENKTLTLQLDPPELGRVKVKMDFGPEKTLKAVLSTDKPETFMMLQRDSSALERALQNAGLDLDDGGLSFELAEHGFDFEQDNKRGGGHDSGGTGAGGETEGEEELIETTMNWHVDPESGHMRYNILA